MEIPSKRSNLYARNLESDHATRSFLRPTESDSGETVQENMLTYISREHTESGQSVVQHVMAHQKISNPSKGKFPPYATDLDAPKSTDSIQPIITSNKNLSTKISSVCNEPNIYDHIPPPGTIKLSNAVRKKVLFFFSYLLVLVNLV